jgi:two-component system, OmpR family, response regulator
VLFGEERHSIGNREPVKIGAMRILVIEDDAETAAYIVDALRRAGHVAEHGSDGRDGLIRAAGGDYDVIVVDRMLGPDGLAIVKTIRGVGVKVPVLFLTARGGIDDRVEGLEAGGDDYLTKPFAFSELMARLSALTRRPPLAQIETVLQVADLEMDLIGHRVKRGGEKKSICSRGSLSCWSISCGTSAAW